MDAHDALRLLRRHMVKRRIDLMESLRTTDKIERQRGKLDELDELEKRLNELLQTGEPPPGSDFDEHDEDEPRQTGKTGTRRRAERARPE